MPDPTPANSIAANAPQVKSIFTSRTYAGLALIALPIIFEKMGWKVTNGETQQFVELLFQLIGFATAIYGRQNAKAALTLTGTPAKSATALLAALFLGIPALYLTGCASTTARGRVTNAALLTVGKFAGKVLISSVANMASDRAKGLQLDYAASASAGLWANMDTIIDSSDVDRIVRAYAGPAAPSLAAPLAAQFAAAQPRDAADRAAVVWALAAGLDSAAGRLKPESGNRKPESKGIVPILP